MRFALFNGERAEAFPKARGVCRVCQGEVVAKCGKYKVWHWSHKSLTDCDQWWESETEWHRSWKDRFPKEWQEIVLRDELTNEKHIADVRTQHGVVVEFQRSSIDPLEVKARENFYKRMVWVIDGVKNDFDRINFGLFRAKPNPNGFASFEWYSRSKLFHRWHTNTPVFIDFGQDGGFWRICRFDPVTKRGVALLVDRDMFSAALVKGETDFSKNGGSATRAQAMP